MRIPLKLIKAIDGEAGKKLFDETASQQGGVISLPQPENKISTDPALVSDDGPKDTIEISVNPPAINPTTSPPKKLNITNFSKTLETFAHQNDMSYLTESSIVGAETICNEKISDETMSDDITSLKQDEITTLKQQALKDFALYESFPESVISDMLFLPSIELAKKYSAHRSILLYAIKTEPMALKYAANSLKNNREFLIEAVKQNGMALGQIDSLDPMKDDREIVLNAVKQNGMAYCLVGKRYRYDREIILEAVKSNGMTLMHIGLAIQDREIVLEAVKQNGNALEYADASFKNDREIVLEAVKSKGEAFRYADIVLKSEPDFILEAIKLNGMVIQYADDSIKKNRDKVLKAVQSNGLVLERLDVSFKSDREIVLEAVKQNGNALLYADNSCKKDFNIVLEAVQTYGMAIEYVPDELKQNRTIALEAIKSDGKAIGYISQFLKMTVRCFSKLSNLMEMLL
jgi:tetratricopeptide (TPR) repeat protein